MDELVADVVVVGFGAAGACAAIEAARAGADVLLIDRFGGGGAPRSPAESSTRAAARRSSARRA